MISEIHLAIFAWRLNLSHLKMLIQEGMPPQGSQLCFVTMLMEYLPRGLKEEGKSLLKSARIDPRQP